MADVWISRKRWTCKYCNVTINDDVPSRKHHETGLRHKNNVKRALQNLYRKGEQERREAETVKREMDRIERLAAASYAKDQAQATAAQTSTSTALRSEPASNTKPTQALPWKPKNKLAAYGSLQSHHGDTEADAKRRREEEEERYKSGQPGDWEQVDPTPSVELSASLFSSQQPASSDRQQVQGFRIREKVGRLDDDGDEQVLEDIRVKKRAKPIHRVVDSKPGQNQDVPVKLEPVIRSPFKLELTGSATKITAVKVEAAASPLGGFGHGQAEAATSSAVSVKPKKEAESEPSESNESGGGASGGLFKKRRAGVGAGAKKVRALV